MTRSFFCRVLAVTWLAPLAVLAQINITGVADKGTYNDTATLTVGTQTGYTYSATLNGQPIATGAPVIVNKPDFYELRVAAANVTNSAVTGQYLRFIVLASARAGTEWGLPAHVPWPVIPSAAAEFVGARLRISTPANFPAGYEIPVVAWVVDADSHAVRANGSLAAAGQNSIALKRGVGSGFLASNQPPGLLNYTPIIGGVTTNQPIQIEAATTWTSVSGVLAGATVWPDHSRIRVTGHLAVPAGSTLTIGVGSIILLNGGMNITNDGAINVNGTIAQPVVFMPNTRSQPWGGFFMRTSAGSLNASGTIFVASGAAQTGGPGHRLEQCLFLVDNSPSVTLTDSAAIYLAGQFGHAYAGGTFTLTRFLLQRATTGGEYTGATWRVNDSAFIEFPDDSVNFVDGDNDALYFVSTPAAGGVNFTNTLIGWTKDDGVDSGGSGYGPLRYQNCWIEATFHEGNSLSGYKDTRAWDTVYINCGQGLEDGYNGPTGRVERCVFAVNQVGTRHGDNYDNIGNYDGRLIVTNCFLLWNHHDVFGYNWRAGAGNGWTQAVGQMFISNNKLTTADTNFPNNSVWNPATDAALLAPYGAKGRVGVALAVRAGQNTLGSFPDGVPVGLSMFCTNEVTVDYAIDSTDGTHLAGVLHFVPGQIQNYIPVPSGFSGVLQIALLNPVNADFTGVRTLLFQNVTPAGSRVLSPLGATWKYLDNGTEQGAAWRAAAFNDAAWASGPARLGFGTDQSPLGTTINRFVTGGSGPQITNFYFRRSINVTNPGAYSTIQFRYQRDDGCIVYLNSNEVFRSNMPAGSVTATNFASTTVSGIPAALTFYTNTMSATNLLAGTNVLAVEVHQSTFNSSDLGWEMELTGLPASSQTRVNISRLGPSAVLYWTDPTFTLEHTTEVANPASWVPGGAASPVAFDPADSRRFFRLKK